MVVLRAPATSPKSVLALSSLRQRSGGLNTTWSGNLIIKQGTWKIVATDGLPYNVPNGDGLRPGQVTLDGGTWQIGATINATNARRGVTITNKRWNHRYAEL